MDEAPVLMNQAIVEVIEQKAKEGKYQYQKRCIVALGMIRQLLRPITRQRCAIFGAAHCGISHNPAEATAISRFGY